jgi:hypothetical protein
MSQLPINSSSSGYQDFINNALIKRKQFAKEDLAKFKDIYVKIKTAPFDYTETCRIEFKPSSITSKYSDSVVEIEDFLIDEEKWPRHKFNIEVVAHIPCITIILNLTILPKV